MKRDKSRTNIKSRGKSQTKTPDKSVSEMYSPSGGIRSTRPNDTSKTKNQLSKINFPQSKKSILNISKISGNSTISEHKSSFLVKGQKSSEFLGKKQRDKTPREINKKSAANVKKQPDINIVKATGEVDVSNIITLEQEVNDDFLINCKEDKMLLNTICPEDEYNNLMTGMASNRKPDVPVSTIEYEEVIDDKWQNFSWYISI
jgi:hypothetical protein